ncbi:MAG TPA: FAD-dependent thymidylate synthase [Methylococcaceae bacterium]|jgi:thymidylate synthase (FAD)|nr:FAD-dependent thymidylate synthase [Methylococcaceae bacterium]
MNYDPLDDGISCVQYVDHMGDDLRVVNAARASFDKESRYECDETGKWLLEEDKQLIEYLAGHEHISPFFHPQICVRINMPLFLARLWWRSTVGVCRSEVYRRYVTSKPQFYSPPSWRRKANNAEDAMEETLEPAAAKAFSEQVESFYRQVQAMYAEALRLNIAPEIAHMILPQSMYTSWIETGSLYYFARVCGLQSSQSAQKELRLFAESVGKIALQLFPVSWAALHSHGNGPATHAPSPG